jgi:Ni/Co efflux regulator RcnB
MNKRTIVCIAAIASVGLAPMAYAQPHHGDPHQDVKHARKEVRHAKKELREARQDRREAKRAERYYYNARGAEFRRGRHIPYELRNRQYVVTNWRAHRLAPPPRGYEWVQVGPDYVLIAIATGLIANLILNQ